MQVDNCTRTASRYANWYGMNVETMKSNIQVVIIRLLGELAAKAGAVDLPLLQLIKKKDCEIGRDTHLTSSTLTHTGLAVKYLYGK